MESPLVWYAMQATYKRNLELSGLLQSMDIEFYIPLKAVAPNRNNMSRDALLLFIHSSEGVIESLINKVEYIRHHFVYENSKRKPVTLSDEEMKRFVSDNKAQYRADLKAMRSAARAAKLSNIA